jgi:fibronectin type 3 domain-containing protein
VNTSTTKLFEKFDSKEQREYFSTTMRNFRRIVLLSCAAASSLLFCTAPSTAPGPSIPPAPISVSAMGVSMSAIQVTWVRILNATSYRVFKSTSETGAFAVVDTVTSNTYYDTGLVPGSVFYYKVSALNDLGESEQSAAVLATTAVPGKVSARFVSPASIIVTWTLVTEATSYNVYRDTSDTGTFSFSRTLTTDTLVDSGLAAGIRYYYRIRAVNNSGESGLSFTKNAITLPAIPAGASAAGVSSSCIVITWPAVTGAASYKIYRNSVDTGAFQLAGSATRDTFSDTSLSAATTYYYKISAVNSSGESGPSASCSAITKKLPTPNNVSAAAVSSSGITITWTAVAGAASYTVYRSTNDTGTYPVIDSVATDTLSDTGLTAGATYYYKIRAVDSSGESGLSAPFTVITIPGVPVGVSASAVSSSAIKITWPAVTGAASFKVYRSDIDTGTYSVIDSVAKDTFNDTGLVAGATYYYKVTGINVSGESKQSVPVHATTLLTGFIPFIRPSLQLAME